MVGLNWQNFASVWQVEVKQGAGRCWSKQPRCVLESIHVLLCSDGSSWSCLQSFSRLKFMRPTACWILSVRCHKSWPTTNNLSGFTSTVWGSSHRNLRDQDVRLYKRVHKRKSATAASTARVNPYFVCFCTDEFPDTDVCILGSNRQPFGEFLWTK